MALFETFNRICPLDDLCMQNISVHENVHIGLLSIQDNVSSYYIYYRLK